MTTAITDSAEIVSPATVTRMMGAWRVAVPVDDGAHFLICHREHKTRALAEAQAAHWRRCCADGDIGTDVSRWDSHERGLYFRSTTLRPMTAAEFDGACSSVDYLLSTLAGCLRSEVSRESGPLYVRLAQLRDAQRARASADAEAYRAMLLGRAAELLSSRGLPAFDQTREPGRLIS